MFERKAQITQNSNTNVESFLTWSLFPQEKNQQIKTLTANIVSRGRFICETD